MNYLDVFIVTLAAIGVVGLVFVSGYETASRRLAGRYQEQADRRVRGLLDDLNTRKPRRRK